MMRAIVLAVMVLVLGAVVAEEASARCGMRRGMQGQNCTCQNGGQMPMRQQLRDGSCLNGGSPQQGTGQGRRMGMGNRNGAAPGSEGTGTPATPSAIPH